MGRQFLATSTALDLFALSVSLVLASMDRYGTPFPWAREARITGLLGLIIASAVLAEYVSFRMWGVSAPQPSYGRALLVLAVTSGLVAAAVVATRAFWSRRFLGVTLGLWILGMIAHRFWRRRRPWRETLVVVSKDKPLIDLLNTASNAEVVEVLDPSAEFVPEPVDHHHTIAIDLSAVLSDRMAQLISSLSVAGYSMRSLSDVVEEHTGRIPLLHISEGWEMGIPIIRKSAYAPVKRVIDIVLVAALSPIILILCAGAALAILVGTGRPVFYNQVRIGRHGQPFVLYKLRTMVLHDEHQASEYAGEGDIRITSVGKFLRKTRLDELPQLWNVLRGDLSLVGPRPEWDRLEKKYRSAVPFYDQRHLVRPGITGWAQVHQGYTNDVNQIVEKLAFDLYYIKHMSPWLDAQILGKTIWTVLTGRGAV